jgi:hypothetical protein
VHDARDARARRRLHGETVAVVAEHDDRVADGVAPVVEELLEQARDLAAPPAQPRSHLRELGRRVVLELAVGVEEPRGPPDQLDERRDPVAALGEERRLGLGERAPHRLGRARGAHDAAEVLRRRGAARLLEKVEGGGEVVEPRERQPAVADLERDGLAGLGEPAPDLAFVGGGNQRQNRRPSGRRSSQGGDQTEDDAELEGISLGAAPVTRDHMVARRSSESLRSIFLRA